MGVPVVIDELEVDVTSVRHHQNRGIPGELIGVDADRGLHPAIRSLRGLPDVSGCQHPAIVHQVLGKAANSVEIVMIEINRLPVRGDCVLVLLLLFVGVAKSGVKLGRTGGVWNGAQDFAGSSSVAFFRCKDKRGW